MLERNAFGCIVFERRVGQYYMCVEILLYSAILFITTFTDHMTAANCPYDEMPGIVKRGSPFSEEIGEKEILIFR